MLPNHAPLVVAEQFALLEAAHPGRIDLGIGRAPGSDPVTAGRCGTAPAASTDDAVNRFPEHVHDVLAMMAPEGAALAAGGRHVRAAGHPGARPRRPTVWLLGSSDYSARLAAELGLPYVFAHHFSGQGTAEALALYRDGSGRASSRRAADVPHRQRRRRGDRRGGRAAGAAAPAGDGRAAHRRCAPAAAAGRGGRGGRAAARARPAGGGDAQPLGRRDARARPRPRSRELAATYGVEEVMVHPVAGGRRRDGPRGGARPRGDAAAAGRGL